MVIYDALVVDTDTSIAEFQNACPMGNEQTCNTRNVLPKMTKYGDFGLLVERAGRFIQYKQRRFFCQRPGNGDTLSLPF